MLNVRVNLGGSVVRNVAENSLPIRQGMALGYVMEGDEKKVSVDASTITSFAGVAFNEYAPQDRMVEVEEFVATSTSYKIRHQAIGGKVIVKDVVAGTESEGSLGVDGRTLTSLTPDTKYQVRYAFVPSYTDVYASWNSLGEVAGSFRATENVKAVSVITRGDIWTDYYDIAIDYSKNAPKAMANGMFGYSASAGVAIPGVEVMSLPSPADAFLHIYFSI